MKKRGLAAGLILMTMVMTAGCGSTAKSETSALQTTNETTAAATQAAPVSSDNTKDGAAVVSTTYGPVKGVQEGELLTWYGIPYGKAPVGELRWQAPAAPDAWTMYMQKREVKSFLCLYSFTEAIIRLERQEKFPDLIW